MKKIKVVSQKNLPARLPLAWTAIAWLFLDQYDVDGVWRGVIYALGVLWWVLAAWAFWIQEFVELPLETLAAEKGGDE